MDLRRAEECLRNLVGNAIEHSEGRPVLVTLAVDDPAPWAVTVRDHGIGLKSGEEKLVFNRFWRADPSRARQTGGTGLGLSISLEDARLHGGWLEAWGAPGQGAQFRLTLPVRAGAKLISAPLALVPADAEVVAVRPASRRDRGSGRRVRPGRDGKRRGVRGCERSGDGRCRGWWWRSRSGSAVYLIDASARSPLGSNPQDTPVDDPPVAASVDPFGPEATR